MFFFLLILNGCQTDLDLLQLGAYHFLYQTTHFLGEQMYWTVWLTGVAQICPVIMIG